MIKFTMDRLLFEKNKMKVPELQQKTGVNKNTLYGIYNNTITRVDLYVLDRICKALNCQPGDFLEYVHDED